MDSPRLISRCTQGKPLTFRWFGEPTAHVGLDIETVLFKFEKIIRAKGKIADEYSLIMACAEIRNRIERAAEGRLRTTHQVKWVDQRNLPPIFELRWQGISISFLSELRKDRHQTLLFRMYCSEPEAFPEHFIGHHLHEKVISDPERIWILQNREIAIARDLCERGVETSWGIPIDRGENLI